MQADVQVNNVTMLPYNAGEQYEGERHTSSRGKKMRTATRRRRLVLRGSRSQICVLAAKYLQTKKGTASDSEAARQRERKRGRKRRARRVALLLVLL